MFSSHENNVTMQKITNRYGHKKIDLTLLKKNVICIIFV